jgi:membrane protein
VASVYGAAGSLALFLLWVYYSAMIFLLGAEFTQVYARTWGTDIRPDRRQKLAGQTTPDSPPNPAT